MCPLRSTTMPRKIGYFIHCTNCKKLSQAMKDPVFFEEEVTAALNILRKGGVILYPTDTIWGLGCDATNAAAINRIYSIKKRAESKSLIILLADEREVLKYVAAPDL